MTEQEKRVIMSEVMRLAVEIMFSTHVYSFGGHCYKQKEGGPIGLRSTLVLARVVMGRWDIKWKERMNDCNLEVEDEGRFVDDAPTESRVEMGTGRAVVQQGVGAARSATLTNKTNKTGHLWEHERVG